MISSIGRFLRERWLECLGAILFVLFVSWPLADPRQLLSGIDTITYTTPNHAVSYEAMRELRLPGWNPYTFGGGPHIANPQVAFFYPLKWPFVMFDSAHQAVELMIVFHLIILAVGCVVLLGGTLKLRKPAALVGAIVFCGSGVVMAKSAGHFEQIITIVWAPWILAAVEAASSRLVRSRWRGLALISFAGIPAVLAGHQQPAYYIFALAGAWGVARAIQNRDFKTGLVVVGGFIGALAASAIQILPTLELVRRTVRAGGLEISDLSARAYLLEPRLVAKVVLGDPFAPNIGDVTGGVEVSAFVGAAALALAALGCGWGLSTRNMRWPTIVLAIGAAGGLFLALGPQTAVYRFLFDYLPGIDLLRVPSRWVLVTDTCLAVLAAFGMHAALLGPIPLRKTAAAGLAVLAAGAIALHPAETKLLAWWLAAGTATFIAGIWFGRKGWAVAGTLLVLLPVLELSIFSQHSIMRQIPQLPASFDAQTAASEFLEGKPGRVIQLGADLFGEPEYLLSAMRPNANVQLGVSSIDGYDGGSALTRRWINAMSDLSGGSFEQDLTLRAQVKLPLDADLFARYGVRWAFIDTNVIDPSTAAPNWEIAADADIDFLVLENPAYRGDAFLLGGDSIDLDRITGGRLSFEADLSEESVAVIAEQWDPGWRATVNGEPADVVPVDDFFLGVPLEAGDHVVHLTYHVPWLVPGALITIATLLALIFMSVLGGRAGGTKVDPRSET